MFPGFTAADFDAYQVKKWKSNVFNRERLEVKQKLASLGRELQGVMIAPDGSPLAVEASVEHPALWNHKQVEAQHLYFSRNEGARKELGWEPRTQWPQGVAHAVEWYRRERWL